MKATLEDRDGLLFVHVLDHSYDRPELIHRWYPTKLKTKTIIESYGAAILEERIVYDMNKRSFVVPGRFPRPDLAVPTSGDAEITTEPIHPPKVRKGTEVRWADGRWEKYSKRDGWVAV